MVPKCGIHLRLATINGITKIMFVSFYSLPLIMFVRSLCDNDKFISGLRQVMLRYTVYINKCLTDHLVQTDSIICLG